MDLDNLQKKYYNKEVTVVWQPKLCIHSAICFKGLSQVFNPRERPWIRINEASSAEIIEQVKKCPSGALSFYLNADEQKDNPSN